MEILDFIHRIYESEESIKILSELVSGKLFVSLVVVQLLIGMIVPLVAIAAVKLFRTPAELRRLIFFVAAILVQVGIFSTRWNVVIGGQLLSKSYRGFTSFLPGIFEKEGLLAAGVIFIIPFLLLWQFDKIFPFFSRAPAGVESRDPG